MVSYKCFNCSKEIKSDLTRKKVRCPYCGSKILDKPRTVKTSVEAI
ncbi:DNA-directed RNA polymerase subunit P [archaeon]|jgi:DNA-directed RNA polymerase subunit P|nr:DNA-directed RNA polymerase subunit P [archaeon]MBT4417430.1 DNA-directed RNA polymerase subunit P [archaeon]